MIRRLGILLILLAAATAAAEPVWVFLDGKAEGEAAWSEARERLSPRALERRARSLPSDRRVQPCDLALDSGHIEALEDLGFELRARSRWLGAVSLDTDAAGQALLRQLPFVRGLRPVAPSRRLRVDRTGPARPAGSREDYGGSYAELDQLNIPAAHDLGYHGEGVIVGILDTGANLGHAALQNVDVLGAWDFIQGDAVISDQPGDPYGQDDHGTTTLSTIAGYAPGGLVGGAWGASFYLAKTELAGSENPIEEDWWVEGLEWLEAMGCDIVSSSLSYDDWYSYSDLDGDTAVSTIASDQAAALGILVITSIGNTRFDTGYLTAPADGDSVLAVGGLDPDGDYAWFSAPGPSYDGRTKPDVMARAVDNHVVDPNSADGYMVAQGTSYTAPLAASAAALVLQANPGVSAMSLRDALRETASQADAPDNDYGWGTINTLSALRYFRPRIGHDPLPDSEDTVAGYAVEATISLPESGLTEAWVVCRVNEAPWDSIPLLQQGGELYGAVIPAQPWGSELDYYLSATCSLGWTSYHPADAPESWHHFHVDQDITPPEIDHLPLGDTPLLLWPAVVEAEVTDNLGLARIWVEYGLNGAPQASFDLDPKVGGSYSGTFPCEVEIGDSLSYRILAEDLAGVPNLAADPPEGEHAFRIVDTPGRVLLLEDAGPRGATRDKEGRNSGRVPAIPSRSASADLMETALLTAGFQVERQALLGSNPEDWWGFHVLAISCGDVQDPLTPLGLPAALIDFMQQGGRLIIEGGEIAYDFRMQTSFLSEVLHASAWLEDNGGALLLEAPDHPLAQNPNILPDVLALSYAGYGDQDVVLPAADATTLYGAETSADGACVLAYDDDPAPPAGQMVFLSLNLAALQPGEAVHLVQNAASYLVASQAPGSCALGGNCELEAGYDHSGVELHLSGQPPQVTGPDGAFFFEGLWPGLYNLQAHRDGYATLDSTFTLKSGQQIPDLQLFLRAMETWQEDSYCNLPIPDGLPSGVIDSIWVDAPSELLDLSVHVNITHGYIGDLRVSLVHPQGISVLLHDRSGGGANNLVGSYPEELVPAESLDPLLHRSARGWWQLHVSDWEAQDTGILNSWGLSLGLPAFATESSEEMPAFALSGNWPNPFNPSTCLEFSLEAPGRTRLGVYDISGRLVAVLIDEDLAAGTHSMLWHGRDQAGRTLPSGIYFARLECGGRRDLRKMLLLK